MFNSKLKSIIEDIAFEYDLEPATMLAVVEVESNGRLGSRVNGRIEPLIRFEGHYFYRLLPQAKRNIAIVRGLASAKAGKVGNPLRQVSRWRLLKQAEKIDRSAALCSCSWGCGQVMGAHWRWLGYASIDALVLEARDGAEGQIRLMMRFIKKAGLVETLQNHDWAGFARAYNGPAYWKKRYHEKMRDAYVRFHDSISAHDRRKTTLPRNRVHILRLGSRGQTVRMLQSQLCALGYLLVVDGDFGPATQRMTKLFQRENKLRVDGIVGTRTFHALQQKLPNAS